MVEEYKIIKDLKYEKIGYYDTKGAKPTFVILGGKITEAGEIVNNAEDFKDLGLLSTALTANTNDQEHRTFNNLKYKKMWMRIYQTGTVVSYDWKLLILIGANTASLRGTTGTQVWYANTIVGGHYTYHGEIPYGFDGVNKMAIYADNNHATDPITLNSHIILYDPVR